MARPTFKTYMENIQTETGRSAKDFWKLAKNKGFIKENKLVARHADLLAWLKSEIGLRHVRANFAIIYLRLRTDDPRLSAQSRDWAYSTSYKEYSG